MTLTADLLLDVRAELGEGALWHAPAGRLYWVDIVGKTVHAHEPATDRTLTALGGGLVGAVVPTRRREVLIALQQRFAFLDLAGGRMTPFPFEPIEPASGRFNDGKCDPAGRFWVGSMALDETPGAGRMHCLHADLHVETKFAGLTIPNGLAWSADARTMFFVDSGSATLDAYDFDLPAGSAARRGTIRCFTPDEGVPDGMTIDAEGDLWIAFWDGWCVRRIDSASGATLAEVKLPVQRVTSCAFGGPALDTLYITTAHDRLSEAQLAAQPLAGGLLVARPSVRGVESFASAG